MGGRGVGDVDRVQLLEGDGAVERRLAGEMDGGHPAAAEKAMNLVASRSTGQVRTIAPEDGREVGLFPPRTA